MAYLSPRKVLDLRCVTTGIGMAVMNYIDAEVLNVVQFSPKLLDGSKEFAIDEVQEQLPVTHFSYLILMSKLVPLQMFQQEVGAKSSFVSAASFKALDTERVTTKVMDLLLNGLVRCDEPVIEFLDLSRVKATISRSKMVGVARSCANLRVLDVHSTFATCLCHTVLTEVVNHAPNLRYLDLHEASSSDQLMLAVAKTCKQLQYLDVSNTSITDTSMVEVVQSCTKLQYLKVRSRKQKVTDLTYSVLALSCSELRHLDIFFNDISDEILALIGSQCRKLTYLNISWSHKVTDKGLVAFLDSASRLKTLEVSRTLHGSGFSNDKVDMLQALYTECKVIVA